MLLAGLDSWLDRYLKPTSAAREKPVELQSLPATLYDYVLDRGFLVDKKPMDFARHRYLVPIYQSMQFRPDEEEDFDRTLMTGAQVGKSITALTLLIYAAQRFWGGKFGYFLPDREMADIFSSDRFLPIVQSNPSLAQDLSTETRVKGAKKEDRKRVRSLGETTIFFSYMGGKTSTEAIPMDGVFFDEVRRMLMGDIERAHERISHASYPVKVKISTAGYPDCFDGDTLITSRHRDTGMIMPMPIRELVDRWKEFDVLSYNRIGGNRPRWRRLLGAVCRGIRPMVKVKLWGGTAIRCTRTHRFALPKQNRGQGTTFSWVPIDSVPRRPTRFGGDIGPGGVLTVTAFPDADSVKQARYDAPADLLTCYAIGAFVAEGTLKNKCLQYWQNPDKPLRAHVQQWASAHGLYCSENGHAVTVSLSRRADLLALFAACGDRADQKAIPLSILAGSHAQLMSLLAGLLDGDGHRRKPRTSLRHSRKEWDFYTCSDTLASQMMFLCRRLGLAPSRSTRRSRGNAKPVHCISHNPSSFHAKEVLPKLGCTGVDSVEDDGDGLAYDLQVEGTPWFVLAESGAVVHNSTIDYYFKRSTQHYFHTRCGCAEGVVLAEVWPDCLGESEGRYFWRCPKCSTVIADPQDGEFRPRTPENHGLGFHVPQILSPVMSPKRLWDKWMNMTDRQEFYNSSLGLPFIDPASILVPLDVAQACEDVSLRWMREGINCVMGVDQRGGENHVVIGEPTKGGRKLALRHLEIIQGDSPFDQLYPLMERYDVDCCIIDALPSYNEAVKFAKAYKRRVFLSYYSDNVHMLRWSDRDEELQALHRAKPDSKFEYHVMLDRYKAIEFALMYWVNRLVACPPAAALVQEVRVKGVKRMSQICLGNPETGEQGLFYHLRSVARRKIAAVTRDSQKRETIDTGAFRMVWENIGIDPHFLHAFLYCVMASQRKQVTAELWTPEGNMGSRVTVEETKKQKPNVTLTQAGDMAQIQTAMRALPAGPSYLGQCGSCESFQAERKHCQARGFSVQADMPACEEYREKGD